MPSVSAEKVQMHHNTMITTIRQFVKLADSQPLALAVSGGNAKMGVIASVSLPAGITCRKDAPCASKCYAMRMEMRRANIGTAYARNLALWATDPASFERQATAAAYMQRFFRWHVSGDIPSAAYLDMMVRVANTCQRTEFLAFTKRFELVNAWIDQHGALPKNLHLLFSAWPGLKLDNPHSLPVAAMVPKGTDPADNWQVCGGNCTDCCCRGCGCWALKPGETICFREH